MTRSGAVFAVCLLLATLLLFLNKLSRTYIGDINAKIQYTNLPEDKVPSEPLPSEITLYIETTGFKLFWSKIRKPVRVQVDLSSLQADYLPTADLLSVIASQLSSDYELVDIIPDTLDFKFDKGITKQVPVIADILISFKKQYDFMEPLHITPQYVMVNGPENILDTITSWKTERRLFENLDRLQQGEIALLAPASPTIALQPKKIRYTIAVEEYTEKTLDIEIEKMNVPPNRQINMFPNKVSVVFRVGLSNYEQVSAETFSAVADFYGVDMNRSKYVPVKIELAPSYIKNLDYSPKSVEYIIYR